MNLTAVETQIRALSMAASMEGTGLLFTFVIYAVVIGGLYFFLIRPQNKKKKKEEAMRKNAAVGDEVTTIGGIAGRIIAIKDESDSVVLETGTDRIKIRLKRWAIGSVDTIHEEDE